MKYILSESEYKELIEAKQERDELKRRVPSQELLTLIADTMPIQPSWRKDKPPRPHGCQLHLDYDRCCGDCPVKNICSSEGKDFSK